jgi:hypothetical protein
MAGDASRERPKIVYVMGAGHSGSTVLGVTLGNCADFFYAGEVEEWLAKAGKPAWGETERMRFWGDVGARVDGSDLFGGEANRCVERSSALLRIDRWAARRRMLARYLRVAGDLLDAISQTASASYIIDTSHFPLRARELKKLDSIDLYLIFLVRDAHGVVRSNLLEISPHEVAERRLRTLVMNANLWLTQLISVCVFLRQPRERRLFLRHEAFLADPEGVLRQILTLVGSDAEIPDLSALRVGMPIEGNRLLRSQVIALRRASEPAERSHQLPQPESLLTKLLQSQWRPVLARLRPAAGTGATGERSS